MKKPSIILTLLLLSLSLALGFSYQGNGIEGDPVRGGQLYDNWMVLLDLNPPDSDQALWDEQSTNPRSGRITWRCKECHGWDYKGFEGAYGPDAIRYTGFPGLRNSVGSSVDEVSAWLDGTNNPDHNFLSVTNPNAVEDLTAFLLTMQIDVNLLIDAQTGLALGSEDEGRFPYAQNCSECHGNEGRRIDFAAGGSAIFLGDVADVDPWRALHKIRFGIPGGNMPSAENQGWSLREMADVLAYMQSLPRGNTNYSISNPSAENLTVDTQGEIQPIIWASSALLLIIAIGLAWDLREKSKKS